MAMDVSYYGTIQLAGTREEIVQLLGQMTESPFAGPK